MNDNCPFCQQDEKFDIKAYQYWTVALYPYQRYLGRCLIKLNRHEIDFLEATQEEKKELFFIMNQLKAALKDLFEPDLFNYASLGNIVRHLHIHFIPRYSKKRTFCNMEFEDQRWNQIHVPYDKGEELPKDVRERLKKNIKGKMKNY